MRATDSSAGLEGMVIRVAASSTSAEGEVVRVAGSSDGADLVGLGGTVSLAPVPDVSRVRPLKTLQSLKVVYDFIAHLNSHTHIPKQHGSSGPLGWPSQPNTEGLGHKPGSSVVPSGSNPDKADGDWGPAGTSSSGGQYSPCGPCISPKGTSKEAQILQASLSGSPALGMATSSPHQSGMLTCQTFKFSHTS